MKNNNLEIVLGTEKDFFNEALRVARKLDKKESIESKNVIMFEEPEELMQFLTKKKREVIDAIRFHPRSSITEISTFLHRHVSSVSRDINSMAKYGIVKVEDVINPGHGKIKCVSLPFKNMMLQASL
jgi:predicted transcriptional regulator